MSTSKVVPKVSLSQEIAQITGMSVSVIYTRMRRFKRGKCDCDALWRPSGILRPVAKMSDTINRGNWGDLSNESNTGAARK